MMERTSDNHGVIGFEEEGRLLVVNVTHEGIILDAYLQDDDGENDGQPVGSMAMTANEWWDHLERQPERDRRVGAVQALDTMLFDYETWVRENYPQGDDDGSSFSNFDEKRADWHESIVRQASVVTGLFPPEKASTPSTQCRHCERPIELAADGWIDPEATGDDSIWREVCDKHDTFMAEHEPVTEVTT